jgi:hypothetical protein
MEFKLASKNNVGVVATIIFCIILSQTRFFNFFIDTVLGRAVLILLILGISYMNKIFGIIAVLFIIIMFNKSDIGYMEGFSDNSSIKDKSKEKETAIKKETLQKQKPATVSSASSTEGREGFNIIDRESVMLKGKRSNEVPVFLNAREHVNDVEPSDKALFSGSYASF